MRGVVQQHPVLALAQVLSTTFTASSTTFSDKIQQPSLYRQQTFTALSSSIINVQSRSCVLPELIISYHNAMSCSEGHSVINNATKKKNLERQQASERKQHILAVLPTFYLFFNAQLRHGHHVYGRWFVVAVQSPTLFLLVSLSRCAVDK